jgi:hypothetical protein
MMTLPTSYLEYYQTSTDLYQGSYAPVMSAFTVPSTGAVRTASSLNKDIAKTCSSMHMAFVSMSKESHEVLLLHRLAYHTPAMGVTANNYENKLYAFIGEVNIHQAPQTVLFPTQGLKPVVKNKVRKMKFMLESFEADNGTDTFPMKRATDEEDLYDIVDTRTMMYVPQKYTTMIMGWTEKPLKMLYLLHAEMTAEGDVSDCKDLLDWFRVAVTRATADEADATSHVTRSNAPGTPIMSPAFVEKQTALVMGDLPQWNRPTTAINATATPATESTTTTLLQQQLITALLANQSPGAPMSSPAASGTPSSLWKATVPSYSASSNYRLLHSYPPTG